MIMLKVLTQYQEATGDPRVIPFMTRYFAHHAAQIERESRSRSGPIYRWHDELLSVLWLYNRTGDAQLLDLARSGCASTASTGRHSSPTSATPTRSPRPTRS